MANININSKPEFNASMTALEIRTPAHAHIFNDMFRQCLENDVAIKRDVETYTKLVGATHIKTFSNVSIDEYQLANNVGLGEGYLWPCYYSQLKDLSAFSDIESYSDVPINFYVSLNIPERRYEGIAHYVLWNKKFYLLGQDAPCPSASIKPFRSCTADYITFIGIKVSEENKKPFSLTISATY